MDQFSYLSVLISIIVALAISQVLRGLSRLIQLRERVLLYWPSIVWAGILLLLDVQTWWSMFGMRAHRDWNFFAFLIVLSQPIGLYLLAVLVFPNFDREEIADFAHELLFERAVVLQLDRGSTNREHIERCSLVWAAAAATPPLTYHLHNICISRRAS